jgi:hypothetical protein
MKEGQREMLAVVIIVGIGVVLAIIGIGILVEDVWNFVPALFFLFIGIAVIALGIHYAEIGHP